MKSRISCCDTALLRKDITRFFPAWVLYTVFLLLGLMVMLAEYDSGPNFAEGLGDAVSAFGIFNAGYALLAAQLLFGDLYNSRMCNALHALPIRRETWFGTHVIAGLLFAAVPLSLAAALSLVFLEELWYIGLYVLGCILLSYLFFFGTALFSALCVGSRFAAVLVYSIGQFLAPLAYCICNSLLEPLMPGVPLNSGWYTAFCPIIQVFDFRFVNVAWPEVYAETYPEYFSAPIGRYDPTAYTLTVEGWWYLAICAVVGILFGIAALALYRRRDLESAGDFIVFRPFRPVFLVLYSLCAGVVLYLFYNIFVGDEALAFLFIGMVIGFFTGTMFLERTVRVFSRKTLVRCVIFAAAVGGAMLAVWLDPLVITHWVPDTQQVASVSLSNSYSYYHPSGIVLTDSDDITDIIRLHQYAVDHGLDDDSAFYGEDKLAVEMTYTLHDGTRHSRCYRLPMNQDIRDTLRGIYTRPEVVFAQDMTDITPFVKAVAEVSFDFGYMDATADVRGLVEALVADCKAGNMAQHSALHEDDSYATYISLYMPTSISGSRNPYPYIELRVYGDCENTLKWFSDNGFLTNLDDQEKIDDYYKNH